jgi:dethiobiotin synthetase
MPVDEHAIPGQHSPGQSPAGGQTPGENPPAQQSPRPSPVDQQTPGEGPRGLFVTGTDTGVGKSILSASLLAAMRAAGEPVRAHKPVVTGLAEPAADWPADHELLAAAAGMNPSDVAPLRLQAAVSPHLAAELEGVTLSAAEILARARIATGTGTGTGTGEAIAIVEGVGGLLVPLTANYTVCDLAAQLGLDVLIAAAPGLGTINHTLLTLRVARAAGLRVRAVVLTPWPAEPSPMERSNRQTIEALGRVEVAMLRRVSGPELGELADAGARLPWRRWLEAEPTI